jgi:hypothetical protein
VVKIPYSEHEGTLPHVDQNTHRRLERTKRIIRKSDFQWPVLDVGDRNWVTTQLENYLWDEYGKCHHVAFESTLDTDFNYEVRAPRSSYYAVLCLEVVEHTMNPLLLMSAIHAMLRPNGVCYLSTPVRNPLGFWFNEACHFSEYSVRSIETLVRYAGFEITDKDVFRSMPIIYGYKSGGGIFRTSLRVWSQKTQLYRLVKR